MGSPIVIICGFVQIYYNEDINEETLAVESTFEIFLAE